MSALIADVIILHSNGHEFLHGGFYLILHRKLDYSPFLVTYVGVKIPFVHALV
jgi:hypothetical protein